jgi:hypothetical protein
MYFSGSCIPTNKIKCNNYYYKTLLLQFYNYDVTGAPMGRLRWKIDDVNLVQIFYTAPG